MNSLPERIMEYAEAKPEATPIQAENLLHARRPGGGGPGALPPRPFGPAPADLPWRLHAAPIPTRFRPSRTESVSKAHAAAAREPLE